VNNQLAKREKNATGVSVSEPDILLALLANRYLKQMSQIVIKLSLMIKAVTLCNLIHRHKPFHFAECQR